MPNAGTNQSPGPHTAEFMPPLPSKPPPARPASPRTGLPAGASSSRGTRESATYAESQALTPWITSNREMTTASRILEQCTTECPPIAIDIRQRGKQQTREKAPAPFQDGKKKTGKSQANSPPIPGVPPLPPSRRRAMRLAGGRFRENLTGVL